MKPFTFLIVVLGLILGFRLASGRPPAPPAPPRVVYLIDAAEPGRDTDHARAEDGDREEVEGLPVPVVPGTRVTEAEIAPPQPQPTVKLAPLRHAPAKPRRRSQGRGENVTASTSTSLPSTVRTISGRLSATIERARDDARLQLEREVTEWLTPEVPTSWKPPAHLITSLIKKTDVQPIIKDYGTLYEATLKTDFAPRSRTAILKAYQREVVSHRLTVLAGSLGFVLACLASLAGYIRADEATKGYYTQWLRMAAAAGVGGSAVAIYQLLV
jgi:hypothetical protein